MREVGLAARSVQLPIKRRISCIIARRQAFCARASISHAPRRHSASIATHLLTFTARSSQRPHWPS